MIASFVVMMPPMIRMMLRMQQLIAAEQGGRRGGLSPEAMDALMAQYSADLAGLGLPLAAVNLVCVLLLAAAIARRLHDTDRSAIWGLLPLPFLAISVGNTQVGFAYASGQRDLTPFEQMTVITPGLFWAAFILLAVFAGSEGTRGPNRFGPVPG